MSGALDLLIYVLLDLDNSLNDSHRHLHHHSRPGDTITNAFCVSFCVPSSREQAIRCLWHLDVAAHSGMGVEDRATEVEMALQLLAASRDQCVEGMGMGMGIGAHILQVLMDLGHDRDALRAARLLHSGKPLQVLATFTAIHHQRVTFSIGADQNFITMYVRALLRNKLWQEALAYLVSPHIDYFSLNV